MKSINLSGKVKLESDESYDTINVSGKIKCDKSIRANFFSANGKIKIQGDLVVAKDVNIVGKTAINNVSCERFNAVGGIDVCSVSAQEVLVTISTDSQISCINAPNVEITKKNSSTIETKIAQTIINALGIDFDCECAQEHAKLNAISITGKNIVMDNVTAEKVTGASVVVGKDCRISDLEYSENLTIDSSSVVKNVKRI